MNIIKKIYFLNFFLGAVVFSVSKKPAPRKITSTPKKVTSSKSNLTSLQVNASRMSSLTPTSTGGSTVNLGALIKGGVSSSSATLNPIGALSTVKSRTTGNTAISLDGAAFVPGASILVASENNVQGAQQAISSVLGSSNSGMISGYPSNNSLISANSLSLKTNSVSASGVSDILNHTQGNFNFNLNGEGGQGGVGLLDLRNGTTVIGGATTTGIVGGFTNNVSVLGQTAQ